MCYKGFNQQICNVVSTFQFKKMIKTFNLQQSILQYIT